MSENYEIDFAVGYTFELLEKLVGECAASESLTMDDYIKKMENEYITDVDSLFDDLVVSTDKEEIRILIGKMLDAKCEWSLINRYDYERNNPDERG
jgi:hypothetical protein